MLDTSHPSRIDRTNRTRAEDLRILAARARENGNQTHGEGFDQAAKKAEALESSILVEDPDARRILEKLMPLLDDVDTEDEPTMVIPAEISRQDFQRIFLLPEVASQPELRQKIEKFMIFLQEMELRRIAQEDHSKKNEPTKITPLPVGKIARAIEFLKKLLK